MFHVKVYPSSGTFGTVTTDYCTFTTGEDAKLDISYRWREENRITYNSSGNSICSWVDYGFILDNILKFCC